MATGVELTTTGGDDGVGVAASGNPTRRPHPLWDIGSRYALIGGWIVFAAIFSVLLPSTFPTLATVSTILSSQGTLVIIALAVVLPLIVGEFDLSIGATLGLGAVIVGVLNVRLGIPILPATLVALAAGALVGAVNAFLVVVVDVDGLVATLGVGTLVTGIGYALSNYNTIAGIDEGLTNAVSTHLLGLPVSFYYGLILALIIWYVLRYTPTGRHMIFVGKGREVARLSGLRVERLRFGAFVFCGLISALAGVVLAGTVSAADPTTGTTFLLPAFSAAFLGSTTIKPGHFNPWGTVVAVYFLVTGIAGFQLLGLSDWIQQVFYGASLVFAVTLSRLVRRRTGE